MQLPDWLSNVDLWSAILGAVVVLLGTKFPVVASVGGALLNWLKSVPKPAPVNPNPNGPVDPLPTIPPSPDLFPENPVLSKLVKLLLERLMQKHGVTSPASALVAELDADPPK